MTYPEDLDLETPEADAAEQAADVSFEEGDDEIEETEPSLDDEVPEGDAQEQSQVLEYEDEDEYR